MQCKRSTFNKATIDKDVSSDFSRVSREMLGQISRCERWKNIWLSRALVWMKSLFGVITEYLARDLYTPSDMLHL
jgi:hypothetical protein